MPLSQKRIDEFARIWEKEFGERLSPDDARIEAEHFIRLVWKLAQPLPHEQSSKPLKQQGPFDTQTKQV